MRAISREAQPVNDHLEIVHTSSVTESMHERRAACCVSGLVKVRIKKTPREDELDGVRLDSLQPGMVKEVSASLASWLVAERYAVPEMRRTTDDDAFRTGEDRRDPANDCPRRRSTDHDRRS